LPVELQSFTELPMLPEHAPNSGLTFVVEAPRFDAGAGVARFCYRLGMSVFEEVLRFPAGFDTARAAQPAFERLLTLTAFILGTSYYKLLAPFTISAPDLALSQEERALVLDIYENGLGEFYARNNLHRFGKLNIDTGVRTEATPRPDLEQRALLLIGGGKDSLVSVQLFERAGRDYTPFAVNPKGPIITSVEAIHHQPLFVARTLDEEMIHLGGEPGYYNGHVPSTAMNSMVAALTCLLFGYDTIVLSNERSANEGNVIFDGREINHQHSKSFIFEGALATVLAEATGGVLAYFSALRPFSEARIAALFARETRFDTAFSSCNRNFRLAGHKGDLWCGACPKCLFTFLMLAPHMDRDRLIAVFHRNLLDNADHEIGYRELTGLAGQKPWECVGEIREAAAVLDRLRALEDWRDTAIVRALSPDLDKQYGDTLAADWAALFTDSPDHLVPPGFAAELFADA
jgi:UDP-N-acetyl-alpha-D-muramoyl-L-alanyl-L-glutamate epimerase